MEEKFIPSMDGMSLKDQAGIAASQKKLSERRFDRIKKGMEEMKERGFYNVADFQNIKDLRKDTEETTDKLEEIITYMEGVYISKGKRNKEPKEIDDYYIEITQRRADVIKLSKEATDTVEPNINADKARKEREGGERDTGRREDKG